jgi:hypothetical protein
VVVIMSESYPAVPRAVFHGEAGLPVPHAELTADSGNGPNVTDADNGLPAMPPQYRGPDVPATAAESLPRVEGRRP